MTHPPLRLAAVVALLALGTLAVSSVDAPARRRATEQQVEVVGATAVCPDVRQVPGLYQSRVSVGAAPLPEGRVASGGAMTGALLSDDSQSTAIPVKNPGEVAVGLGTTLTDDGMSISATGALATGLEVEQVVRGNDGRTRGLAGVRCGPPQRDTWFVGASTGLADQSVLVLANIDDSPAVVDITGFGHTGPFDPRLGQGLTVAPHHKLAVPLDTFAPDMELLAVNVASRQGRVVAALRDARGLAGRPLGFDYVPQTMPPATEVTVGGIPSGPVRRLVVGNPTDDDTTVSVQVTLTDGQFVPSGMDAVDVPARSTQIIDLSPIARLSALSATVRSTGAPVLAGLVMFEAADVRVNGIREVAFGGSSPPLSGPALLTDLVINRPTESTLVLSAPGRAARVAITPITVLGARTAPPPPRTVAIPAGRTITVPLSRFYPPGTNARLAIEVRPLDGSGQVYAARYLRERGARGILATFLALQGPSLTVARPVAVQDNEAAYP